MSNDKPRLRFSTIEIHIVKIMVDGIIILRFTFSYRKQFKTQLHAYAVYKLCPPPFRYTISKVDIICPPPFKGF